MLSSSHSNALWGRRVDTHCANASALAGAGAGVSAGVVPATREGCALLQPVEGREKGEVGVAHRFNRYCTQGAHLPLAPSVDAGLLAEALVDGEDWLVDRCCCATAQRTYGAASQPRDVDFRRRRCRLGERLGDRLRRLLLLRW